ncbi:hypothetical protein HK100_004559 [Physocladia obscura]|uniref:ubiquitinyl hydrolase 1 n=1 Tax=Physocladia obscura TaxID=109957 RepID=A0AAD5SSJ0_9FUNG|nr:hypothetical protein HK100_004559 [Physocladia obscura]
MQRSVFLPSGHSYKNNSRVIFGEYLEISRFCLNSGGNVNTPSGSSTSYNRPPTSWADLMLQTSVETPANTSFDSADPSEFPPPLSIIDDFPVPTARAVSTGGLIGGSLSPSTAIQIIQLPNRIDTSSTLAQDLKDKSAIFQSLEAVSKGGGVGGGARYLYRLQAVVIHYGSHDSGHFVTYRRCPHPLSPEFARMGLSAPPLVDGSEPVKSEQEQGVRGFLRNRKRKSKTAGTKTVDESWPTRWFRISDSAVDLVKNVEEEVFGHASQYAYMPKVMSAYEIANREFTTENTNEEIWGAIDTLEKELSNQRYIFKRTDQEFILKNLQEVQTSVAEISQQPPKQAASHFVLQSSSSSAHLATAGNLTENQEKAWTKALTALNATEREILHMDSTDFRNILWVKQIDVFDVGFAISAFNVLQRRRQASEGIEARLMVIEERLKVLEGDIRRVAD